MRRGTRKWSAFWLALVLVIQTGCGAAGTSQSTEAGESQTAGESQEQESQAEAELASPWRLWRKMGFSSRM